MFLYTYDMVLGKYTKITTQEKRVNKYCHLSSLAAILDAILVMLVLKDTLLFLMGSLTSET